MCVGVSEDFPLLYIYQKRIVWYNRFGLNPLYIVNIQTLLSTLTPENSFDIMEERSVPTTNEEKKQIFNPVHRSALYRRK